MRIGSLFSGYEGLGMACEAAFGATTAWVSDIDPGACKILAHRYPDVPNIGDITKVDWSQLEPVDILTGGFPCQDLSHAGKRAGLRPGTRSGLWTHMAYAISQLRPRYVVAENVRGLLSAEAHSSLEPCPWCVGGSGDGEPDLRALGCVLGDLAELGYDAQWVGLRAADVGAPHGRFRVFVLATDTRRSDWRREDAGRRTPGGLNLAAGGRVQGSGSPVLGRGDAAIDYSLPGCICHIGGMGRRTDCPLHGLAAYADRATGGERRQSAPGQAESGRSRADTGGRDRALTANPSGERHGRGEDGRSLGLVDGETAGETREWERAREVVGDRGAAVAADAEVNEQRESAVFGPVRDEPRDGSRGVAWGEYEPAIRRWERVLGRLAPAPTETSPKGSQRLSPRFVEFLMGLPEGHVTDVPDLGRNAQLKALGNGVVSIQAYAAITHMLEVSDHAQAM